MTDTSDKPTDPLANVPGTPEDPAIPPKKDPNLPYAETVIITIVGADGQPLPDVIEDVRESATKAATPSVVESIPPQNVFAISFSHIQRSAAFIRLGLETPVKNTDIPSARHATYLMLNAETLGSERNKRIVRDEVSIIAGCRDFEVFKDDVGNLVIVAFSERGGVEKLFNIERAIRQNIPSAKMMIGDCTIEKTGQTEFALTDKNSEANTGSTLALKTVEGNTLITSALATKIYDPKSRVGSNTKLYSAQATNPKFVRLIEAVSLVSKEQGGPDRLIGYNNEFTALLKAAMDDETGIISLEGAAGMGKSRLRTELLNRLPNYVTCSCEASDRNIQGSSLVTLADQLTRTIEEDEFSKGDIAMTGDQTIDEQSVTLQEFKDWQHADKIKFAVKHPEAVADLCYNALVKLRESKDPKTLFVLEDLHHADRISESFLIDLTRRYCRPEQGNPQAKALVTARPEEMYQSQSFKELKTQGSSGRPQVRIISLKGLELLERDELGRDFAYYSLPPELRENKKLGTWYRLLAGKAKRSPFFMKSFMDQVAVYNGQTATYPNIEIIGNTIEVKKDCLGEIGKIKSDSDSDMATYFQERIAVLPQKTRRLLQCIALMEERLTPWQTIQLAEKVLGIAPDELSAMASELSHAGYFVEDKLEANSCRLQHESTREIVVRSIEDEATKMELAKNLYDLFKGDKALAVKSKHTLAQVIGTSMPTDHEEFWQEYGTLTGQLFADAEYHNDAQYGYETAKEALGLPVLQTCIAALCQGSRTYPEQLETLAVKCLMAKADYSGFLGKFDEAERTIETLKALHAHLPEVVDILAVHLSNFEKACMETADAKKIAAVYEDIQNCGKPIPKGTQVTLDIRLAVFQGRSADAIAVYRGHKAFLQNEAGEYMRTHSSPSPLYMELRRLCEAKCPYDLLRRVGSRVDGHDFDDDVIKQRGAFTPNNLRQLETLLDLLVNINRVVRAHPMILNPWSEVKVTQQQGEILAYLGRYDEAVECLSESWRVTMQLGLYDQAGRVAKSKGDTEIMQALTGKAENRIRLIKKAINTYSKEGIVEAGSHISEQAIFQFILRVERIRAIGILALELEKRDAQELMPYIETAIADFKYLNKTPQWAEMATDPKHPWHSITHYYLMGFIGHILKTANSIGIKVEEYLDKDRDIYDETNYPFMNIGCMERAIETGHEMTDLGFGEVAMKIEGLHILTQALRRREHLLVNRKRSGREKLFPHTDETIEVPRGYIAIMEIGMDTKEAIVIDSIKKHSSEFIENVGVIRKFTQAALESEPTTMELNITRAILEFVRINTDFPNAAQDPESLYQIMGYMGHIIQTAQREGISIDNNIFNEEECPYMKIENVSAAYEFGKRVIDLGHQGEVEKKMDGLFALLNILRDRRHQQKKQAHQERDLEFLKKRAI